MKKIISVWAMLCVMASMLFAGSTSLYFENDVFHERDHDYTHGTKLTTTYENCYSIFLWQGIYTPGDKRAVDVIEDDRPYSGWLALGGAKQYEWADVMNVTELSVGVVGPSSYAKETQSEIHRMIDNFILKGWDNQLEDEPALTLRHEIRQAWWILGDNVVLVPQSEAVVGTVMDYVGVGADLMFGFHPDPYPYPAHYISVRNKDKWVAYLFVGTRGRYVAWNMLLDGNIWHDSHSVESEPWVGELYAGFYLAYNMFSISLTDIVRTKEFETQNEPERFGCLNLTVYF